MFPWGAVKGKSLECFSCWLWCLGKEFPHWGRILPPAFGHVDRLGLICSVWFVRPVPSFPLPIQKAAVHAISWPSEDHGPASRGDSGFVLWSVKEILCSDLPINSGDLDLPVGVLVLTGVSTLSLPDG
jgi:hypothetical protein